MWVPIAQVTREVSDPISVVSGVVDFTYPYGCPVRSHGSRENVTIVSITYSEQRKIPPLHKSWARVPTKMELRDKVKQGSLFRISPVLSTCPLRTNSGCGKERRILSGPWWPSKATLVWNYLEVYRPCAGEFSAVSAISTQLRDPIKGLANDVWRF